MPSGPLIFIRRVQSVQQAFVFRRVCSEAPCANKNEPWLFTECTFLPVSAQGDSLCTQE